jgi:hypothetical protein
MRTNRKAIILFVVLLFALGACVSAEKGGKSLSEMTPKEKATWFMGIYNSQARDYKAMVARKDLTNEQKDILRKKKSIMTEVWPLINTYIAYVDTGAVVTKTVEDEIIGLVNDLTSLVLPVMVEEGG